MLSFINITLGSSNNSNSVLSLFGLSSTSVSALSYESNVGIGFSFNPTLSISFSSTDLVISNLAPGTTSDSNNIVVSVSTNAAYGYTLSTNVGSNNIASPYYGSSDLVHSSNNNGSNSSNHVFSSIAIDANYSNLSDFSTNADINTWGYSTSLDSGTTWSSYNGLSTSTNTTLVDSNDMTSSTIDFKIAAKASDSQASGVYSNVINFMAVSKPKPKEISDLEYMQDFADLNTSELASVKSSMLPNTTYTLKDKRDEQEYTIAKLKDGKVWMTKNLNIAGGTMLSAGDTDFENNYILPTSNGFQDGNKLPISSKNGFSDNFQAYLYNSGNNTDICSNPGCYSYYSWITATLGSGVNINDDNIDAPYSICPKGWRLPNSRSVDGANWQTADFYKLAVAYGMDPANTYQSTNNFYNWAGPRTTPNFIMTSFYTYNDYGNGQTSGLYWSATSKSNTTAYYFIYQSSYVNTSWANFRMLGLPIRCLVK